MIYIIDVILVNDCVLVFIFLSRTLCVFICRYMNAHAKYMAT